MIQFKALPEKHENLYEENNDNLVTNKELKVESMEVHKNTPNDKEAKQSKTKSDCQDFPCQDCIYVASCKEELAWQLQNEHNHDEPDETDYQSHLTCNMFGIINTNKGKLIIVSHRKMHVQRPSEIVSPMEMWSGCFEGHSSTSAIQALKQFKCGFCNRIFENKSDFMIHRGKQHAGGTVLLVKKL